MRRWILRLISRKGERIVKLKSLWPVIDWRTGEVLGPLWLVDRNGRRSSVRTIWRKGR